MHYICIQFPVFFGFCQLLWHYLSLLFSRNHLCVDFELCLGPLPTTKQRQPGFWLKCPGTWWNSLRHWSEQEPLNHWQQNSPKVSMIHHYIWQDNEVHFPVCIPLLMANMAINFYIWQLQMLEFVGCCQEGLSSCNPSKEPVGMEVTSYGWFWDCDNKMQLKSAVLELWSLGHQLSHCVWGQHALGSSFWQVCNCFRCLKLFDYS